MSTPKTLDRKAFLSSCMAWAAATLSGCGNDGGSDPGGGTAGTGGTTGGTTLSMGGTGARGGVAAAGTGGAATAGMSGAGGAAVAGASGAAAGGMSGAAGAVSSGGTGGVAAVSFMCTTDTNNGDHSHPLTIPSSDVDRAAQDAPYTLEDGGTGHTHTLEVSAYDFIYIRAGTTMMLESSTDEGHLHTCTIACTQD